MTLALAGNLDNSTAATFEAKLKPAAQARPAAAVPDFTAMAQANPKLRQAAEYFRQGNYLLADTVLMRLNEPFDPVIWEMRAEAELRLGKRDLACRVRP